MVTKKNPDALRREQNSKPSKREVQVSRILDRLSERFDFGQAKVLLITIRAMLQLSLYFGKIPTELDANKFRTTCFTNKKSLPGRQATKHLRKRILNIAFTDFGFAKI
jgi:hypothetical protein